MPGSILLIGSDDAVTSQVEKACEVVEARLSTSVSIDDALATISAAAPEVVLIDVDASAGDGFHAFDRLREEVPRLCAILIAARSRSEQAIEAMKRGAIDYLLKPLNQKELISHLQNALRIGRGMAVPTVYESTPTGTRELAVDRIIGQSPAMHEVFKLIGLIAPRDVNVLITGESGTGKELIAKAIYHHSLRTDKPFLAVNCAAIPETLLESELFGHEKGAFTGADTRRIGKFEQCNGGSLFLDEIGDLPLATQAKLLRVLQDGSFQRLGSAETIYCNVRIIAATNQPLERLIQERRFREDLYYRLKVTSIDLPPLREREVDVVMLAHYFVRTLNPQLGTHVERFAPEVLPALLSYQWPGNVRELENVIKASLVVARGNVFQLEFLPERIRQVPRQEPGGLPPAGRPSEPAAEGQSIAAACRRLLSLKQFHGQIYQQVMESAQREVIRACLEETRGQLAPAARLLGITRTTLRKKMAELGIRVSAQVDTQVTSDQGG